MGERVMKLVRIAAVIGVGILGWCMLAAPPATLLQADETPAESTEAKPRKAPAGRVPNHYGKLNLSAKQKEDIYAIQARYRERELEIVRELQELESLRNLEIRDVLSPEQKTALTKIEAEALAKRKEAKTASE
jgi:hypothetical protein